MPMSHVPLHGATSSVFGDGVREVDTVSQELKLLAPKMNVVKMNRKQAYSTVVGLGSDGDSEILTQLVQFTHRDAADTILAGDIKTHVEKRLLELFPHKERLLDVESSSRWYPLPLTIADDC